MTGGELEALQRRARDMQRAARLAEAFRRIGWALVLAALVLGLGAVLGGCSTTDGASIAPREGARCHLTNGSTVTLGQPLQGIRGRMWWVHGHPYTWLVAEDSIIGCEP